VWKCQRLLFFLITITIILMGWKIKDCVIWHFAVRPQKRYVGLSNETGGQLIIDTFKLVLSARSRPQKKSLERGIKSKEKFTHLQNKERGIDVLVSTPQWKYSILVFNHCMLESIASWCTPSYRHRFLQAYSDFIWRMISSTTFFRYLLTSQGKPLPWICNVSVWGKWKISALHWRCQK
jgi:hypothetical protein